MKVRLLHRDRNFDRDAALPWNEAAISHDLELGVLIEGMAGSDAAVATAARTAILTGLGNDVETIRYRQAVLVDCLGNAEAVRRMYAVVAGAVAQDIDAGRSSLAQNPDWVLRWASATIESYLDSLEQLRRLAERHRRSFVSEGLGGMLAMLSTELGAEYCAAVRSHLRRMKFRDGMLLGATLAKGNAGADYILLEPPAGKRDGGWTAKLPWLAQVLAFFGSHRTDPFSFTIDPTDETGVKALAAVRNRGLALVAGALGESVDHVRGFLRALRDELAFYVGCLNLHERLRACGVPVCMPSPSPAAEHRLAFERLCEPALALTLNGGVVSNDLRADDKDLILVTGANQGGKSTFLRSVGLAQLMMQSGMFVAAGAFSSSLVDGLATHFRREETAGADGGRLDEELARMSEIVDRITPRSLILLNESFAATNEREGSEIAHQILTALTSRRLRIVAVTHFYQLAQRLADGGGDGGVLFLKAERRQDGSRSFKMVEGAPLPTGYGEDLYDEIFGAGGAAGDADTPAPRDREA